MSFIDRKPNTKIIPKMRFDYAFRDPYRPMFDHPTGVPVVRLTVSSETGWYDAEEREAALIKESRGKIDDILIVGKGYEYRVGWAIENNPTFAAAYHFALDLCLKKLRAEITQMRAGGQVISNYYFQSHVQDIQLVE